MLMAISIVCTEPCVLDTSIYELLMHALLTIDAITALYIKHINLSHVEVNHKHNSLIGCMVNHCCVLNLLIYEMLH